MGASICQAALEAWKNCKQESLAWATPGGGMCLLLFHCGSSLVTLYRGGRPTSVVLLLLMIVAKLALPLSRHPPLGLHHLLRLVGAARGLVSLGGIEVLEIRRRGPRPAIKFDRLRALGPASTTGVCCGKCQLGRCWDVAQPALMCILTKLGPVSGRAGRKGRFELTSATRNPEHFTALDQILDGALNLCDHHQH